MNNLDKIFDDSNDIKDFANGYIEYLYEVMKSISTEEIEGFCNILLEAREKGTRVFFIGNGGSAATASHFIIDQAVGTGFYKNKPLRAMALTDNNAVLTALGNDLGYDSIFVTQLQALMERGDVVVAISASGNSSNVIKALEYAKEIGGVTIGMSGFDGGKMKQIVDQPVHVPTEKGEYGPAEDAHMIIDHILVSYLMRKFSDHINA